MRLAYHTGRRYNTPPPTNSHARFLLATSDESNIQSSGGDISRASILVVCVCPSLPPRPLALEKVGSKIHSTQGVCSIAFYTVRLCACLWTALAGPPGASTQRDPPHFPPAPVQRDAACPSSAREPDASAPLVSPIRRFFFLYGLCNKRTRNYYGGP